MYAKARGKTAKIAKASERTGFQFDASLPGEVPKSDICISTIAGVLAKFKHEFKNHKPVVYKPKREKVSRSTCGTSMIVSGPRNYEGLMRTSLDLVANYATTSGFLATFKRVS